MPEQEPSEANGAPNLSGALEPFIALVRASDTFRLVTSEGASRLRQRARQRRFLIDQHRGAVALHTPDVGEQNQLGGMLALAEAEAGVQEFLAGWLERIAEMGDAGRDA